MKIWTESKYVLPFKQYRQKAVLLFYWESAEKTMARSFAEQFYNSKDWQICREAFLKSKNYMCERCSTPINPIVAKIAHHKIYLTKQNINDPYITLSWDNLEALCQNCHNKEHHRSNSKRRYAFDKLGNLISPPV